MNDPILRLGDNRGFTPSDNENDNGRFGGLAEGATGDWSWKPYGYPGARENRLKGRSKDQRAFKGVPRSVAEQEADYVFPNLPGDTEAFQDRAIAAHVAAGDYTYHNPRAS